MIMTYFSLIIRLSLFSLTVTYRPTSVPTPPSGGPPSSVAQQPSFGFTEVAWLSTVARILYFGAFAPHGFFGPSRLALLAFAKAQLV